MHFGVLQATLRFLKPTLGIVGRNVIMLKHHEQNCRLLFCHLPQNIFNEPLPKVIKYAKLLFLLPFSAGKGQPVKKK